MPILNLCLLAITLIGALVGGWGIYWARADHDAWRARWGRRVFVLTLLALGGSGLLAAALRSAGLAPVGLLAGLLVVGMLWEGAERQPVQRPLDEPTNAL